MPPLFVALCCAICLYGEPLRAADAVPAPPKNVVEPLSAQTPAWPAGYQARYTLRIVSDPAKSTSKSVVARLPTGGWLKPDGSDVVVQSADGTQLPVTILSHAPTGDTLIQFPRHGADVWYWASAVNAAAPPAKPSPLPEGIVLETRDWAGSDISSWAAVREGLTRSEPVLYNSLVSDIMQKGNPARPLTPRNYAVTYRGTLNIKADGVYRFFVNSEDASFLFIDGLKVCDRPGPNSRMVGTIPTRSIGTDVELKAGLHPIEVDHVLTENPNTYGGLTLIWVPPGAKTWAVVPRESFSMPDLAHVAAFEGAAKSAALFGYGIDDTLVTAGGSTLFLVRFEAQGNFPDGLPLNWDFGDGTKASGRSVRHVYFAPGDYQVSLSTGGPLPPFRSRVHVYAAPGQISPFSVGTIIESLSAADWRGFPFERQDQLVDFLLSCDHPDRWKFLEEVARFRLGSNGLDPQLRAQLYRAQLESLGHLGRAAEIKPVMDKALKEFAKLPSIEAGIQLTLATIYHRQLKNTDEAARRYEELLREHRRLEHPDVRRAAIGWGDLLAEANDLKRAGELYRMAATLGGEAFQGTATAEAVTRGALLRVAEQKLRAGDINESRMLLDKIEIQFPEQKLEGLYRFLRAESDRFAGRYEEALVNYEVLLKLRQWAGYRDRTLRGIADCYVRMDDLPQATRWYEELRTAFPKYYEEQKLAEEQKLISARQARAAEQAPKDGKPAMPRNFTIYSTGFEPGEAESFGTAENFKIVRGLGIAGPHVGLMEAYPIYLGYLKYNRPIANLVPGGHYWIECWYRETMMSLSPGFSPHMSISLVGEGMKSHPTRGSGTLHFERLPGSWQKVGFALDAAQVQDGNVTLSVLAVGAIEIDGLTIRAVSDRQLDALSNFIEGTTER